MKEKTRFDPNKAQQAIEAAVAEGKTPDLAALFAEMETPDEAKARLEQKAG